MRTPILCFIPRPDLNSEKKIATDNVRSYSWFKEERIRRKIANLDAPGFAAMNYPDAAREQLLTMAKLIAWVR